MKEKYLYLITWEAEVWYDTFNAAIVCAESVPTARKIEPTHQGHTPRIWPEWRAKEYSRSWAEHPRDVAVKKVGIASGHIKLNSVVCANFQSA